MKDKNKKSISKDFYKLMDDRTTIRIHSFAFDIFVLLLIFFSTTLVFLEAVEIPDRFDRFLTISEYVLIGLFFIEWVMHFVAADHYYPEAKSSFHAKLKWIFSFSSIIDIICLLTLLVNLIPEESKWRFLKFIKLVKLLKIPEYLWFLHRRHNYHTHTMRCGHAEGLDEEYVLEALANGYSTIGFSDHIPLPNIEQPRVRPNVDQIDNYVRSINILKKKYSHQANILIGYEAEYFPIYKDYYKELLEKRGIQYLILGQHMRLKDNNLTFYNSTENHNNIENVKEYVDSVIEGMRSGLFIYVAHPDMIMNSFDDPNDPALLKEVERIIDESVKLSMPLEINLGGLYVKLHHQRKNYLGQDYKDYYPYDKFFELAGQKKAPVIIGVDAHKPMQYSINEYGYALGLARKYHLKLVKKIKFPKNK